jgi:hypothetical protein
MTDYHVCVSLHALAATASAHLTPPLLDDLDLDHHLINLTHNNNNNNNTTNNITTNINTTNNSSLESSKRKLGATSFDTAPAKKLSLMADSRAVPINSSSNVAVSTASNSTNTNTTAAASATNSNNSSTSVAANNVLLQSLPPLFDTNVLDGSSIVGADALASSSLRNVASARKAPTRRAAAAASAAVAAQIDVVASSTSMVPTAGVISFPPPTADTDHVAAATAAAAAAFQQQQIVSAASIIHKARDVSVEVTAALTTLRTWLVTAPIPLPDTDAERLRAQVDSIRKHVQAGHDNCVMVRETVLLKVDDQQRLLDLLATLATQAHQLDIYERELDYIRQYAMEPPPFADLFIAEQPFPISVYHHKPLPSPLRVRLFTSARARVSDIGAVNVELMHDAGQSKQKSDVVMKNQTKRMVDGESHDREANFEQLTFDKGTRLQQVTLKFNQQIKVQGASGAASAEHLESNTSEAFIVTTHENQWAQAEGALFEHTLFLQQMSVPWPLFANAFQILYLRSTRQEADGVKRPLCVEEFGYLHAKLGGKRAIERSAWNELWKKLQDCLRKIRFAKHLCEMWNEGAIAGFVNRTDTERVLQAEPVGAFMVRFSDSTDGSFVISYVNEDESGKSIKHYLVTEQDTSTKKSLAEFVRAHPRLVYLVKVGVHGNTGLRTTHRELKEAALSKYYGKNKLVSVPSHYESRL